MTKDMTEGRIIPQLTEFTIPLVLGNLFQLTYNAADSVIVGKFLGDDALAAVGKNLKSVAVEMEDLIETESNSTDLRVW